MANRLRRLLFGAPHIAHGAPHPDPAARPRPLLGGSAPGRWVTASAAGTLEPGWFQAWWQSSAQSAPLTETVLVLILNPDHDAMPEIHLARTLSAEVRAVYVEEDPGKTRRLLSAWARTGDGVPLLVLRGDGLPVAASLCAYVDLLARERTMGAISIVLPVCESGACRAKIRCVLRSLVARMAFGRRPGVRMYGGGLALARSRRTLSGCAVEA